MKGNQADLTIREQVWTHKRSENYQSILQVLAPLATITHYQRDEQIYCQGDRVNCWYRINGGAAKRFAVQADGRRQTVDLLLPGDFFGFGVGGIHAFTAEAIAADTVIARYPVSRIETLSAANPRVASQLSEIIIDAISRLHSLLLILGRTTAEEKVASFLLHMQERIGNGSGHLSLPITRYDIADYLALSVETVSRSLTALKERGIIALSGPRKIRIFDRHWLAGEHEAVEAVTTSPLVERPVSKYSLSRPALDTAQIQSVVVRVLPFAFGRVLNEMRRWLDHQRCKPPRFTCLREGSGAVIIRVEFTKESDSLVEAFKQEFASFAAIASE